MRRVALTILLVAALFSPAIDAQQAPATRIVDRTGGAQRTDGFIPFYWDATRGRVLIEIPAFGEAIGATEIADRAGELTSDRRVHAALRDGSGAFHSARIFRSTKPK